MRANESAHRGSADTRERENGKEDGRERVKASGGDVAAKNDGMRRGRKEEEEGARSGEIAKARTCERERERERRYRTWYERTRRTRQGRERERERE